jgi:hypothetical protein
VLKLCIDNDLLREYTYKTPPRAIRDDFFTAPLQINLHEEIEGHRIVKESFNVEIRMPCLEIVTSTDEVSQLDQTKKLFKTTMIHHLTGA